MIAILAITIPPLVCVYIRNKILEKKTLGNRMQLVIYFQYYW